MSDTTSALASLLRQALPLISAPSGSDSALEFARLFNHLCTLVLDEMVFRGIWDESILLQLSELFRAKPPHSIFGAQLEELERRIRTARPSVST